MATKEKEIAAVKEETTTTATTTATTEENANVDTFTAKVENIIFNQDTDRISVVTDVTFPTIKMGSVEESESNTFGLHIFNLVNQVKDKIEIICIADAFNTSINEIINPSLLKLALVGATITFARERVEKGDLRQNGETYSNDGYITTIVDARTDISAIKQQMIFQLLQTKPTILSRKARAAQAALNSLNPFNI